MTIMNRMGVDKTPLAGHSGVLPTLRNGVDAAIQKGILQLSEQKNKVSRAKQEQALREIKFEDLVQKIEPLREPTQLPPMQFEVEIRDFA